ncbi:MAG: hypothetical protein U9N34_07685 [Candidatus Cloacimonadota bacterium]|nr:hypothetical protein [Candidatus Cloacimonadota bacterium]
MKEFFVEEWKNISLMFLLAMITIYLLMVNETQVVVSTIIPMLAIGLNLIKK